MDINIFWTGGLDSTFRVLELLVGLSDEYSIQPFYILDEERKSTKQELSAIRYITKIANNRTKNSVKIKPIVITNKKDIPYDSRITSAYDSLRNKYGLGTQYDWLARFAKWKDINIELGLEYSPRSKAQTAINSEGILTLSKIGSNYETYSLDSNESSEIINQVFGRFMLGPRLFNTSKEDEIKIMNQLGFGDLIAKTWFCHRPILGMPCGHCNPCKDALNEGMAWRVPLLGRILGTLRIPCDLCFKAFRKIISLIRNK